MRIMSAKHKISNHKTAVKTESEYVQAEHDLAQMVSVRPKKLGNR